MAVPAMPAWFEDTLQLATPSVRVESLNPKMAGFLVAAGALHTLLFRKPLVITSGNDGQHVPNSAHGKNAAVDLRSRDKDLEQQAVFGFVLSFIGMNLGVCVYDERAALQPHWHCEDSVYVAG